MTISQMIQQLEKIREERGDIRVMVESRDAYVSINTYSYLESMGVGDPIHFRNDIVVNIFPAPDGYATASVTVKT